MNHFLAAPIFRYCPGKSSGAEVLTAFAGICPPGWKVFVQQPIADVYATIKATMLRTEALMVAGLLISAFAALWRVRGLVHPNGFANMY